MSVEENQKEIEEKVKESYENIGKIEEMLSKIVEIINNKNLSAKGKAEEMEKLNNKIREEYRNFLKSQIKNKTLINIINKINNNDIMQIDRNTIRIFDNVLNNNEKIEKIISIFGDVVNNISINRGGNIITFTLQTDKINTLKITIRNSAYEEALKIHLPNYEDYDELIRANEKEIKYVDNLENLYYKFDNYTDTIKHLLAYYPE